MERETPREEIPQNLDRSVPESQQHSRPPVNPDPAEDRNAARKAGTGIGATAGGIAGAAAGAIGGPLGMAAGAAIGALGGGLMGRAVAETIDPAAEDEYWRQSYTDRPYVEEGMEYDAYRPAYRFGWESYGRYGEKYRSFDEADAALASDWERSRGENPWNWSRARGAARDAWDRVAHRQRQQGPGRS